MRTDVVKVFSEEVNEVHANVRPTLGLRGGKYHEQMITLIVEAFKASSEFKQQASMPIKHSQLWRESNAARISNVLGSIVAVSLPVVIH